MIHSRWAPLHFDAHVVVSRKVAFKATDGPVSIASHVVARFHAIHNAVARPVVAQHRDRTVLVRHEFVFKILSPEWPYVLYFEFEFEFAVHRAVLTPPALTPPALALP